VLVQDLLHRSAERLPDKVALVCGRRRLTYGEIDAAANRLANAMIRDGVKRGDRVVLFLHNSVEAVIGIFATLKAGAAFVALNPTMGVEKLALILNHCRATALISEAEKRPMVEELVGVVPSLRLVVTAGRSSADSVARNCQLLGFEDIQAASPATRPARSNIDLDLACLIYTSGSTGEPKGVMADHSNVIFAASSVTEYLEHGEDDVVLNVLPLSFGYGLYQALMMFQVGGRLVLGRSLAFPAVMLESIQTERVTGFPGVPTIFAMLLQIDLTPYDLSSVRYVTNAAAALPTSYILELRRRFPRAKLYSMYGLTETKRALYLPPEQLERRPNSVGIAIPGTEVWLEDEAGNRLGPGQVGELVVRGRHVMRGYWEAPEATAARFRPGPTPGERICYTDDLFKMDEDGYFYFVARKDDIIKSRGEKIAPKEVEDVLYSLPGVVDAAVIGVPDPILGQALKAFIVSPGAALTEQAVLAHCKERLEAHMIPKHVEFRTELPKTPSGKIRKADLTAGRQVLL
jgi:amino acid adenylation domain-containing protein